MTRMEAEVRHSTAASNGVGAHESKCGAAQAVSRWEQHDTPVSVNEGLAAYIPKVERS